MVSWPSYGEVLPSSYPARVVTAQCQFRGLIDDAGSVIEVEVSLRLEFHRY